MSSSITEAKEYKEYKLKCYFAHPYKFKDTPEKYKIMEILKERGVDAEDPFVGEDHILKKHGVNEYYEGPSYKLGREIWIRDFNRINTADMILAWIPITSMGTSVELYHAYLRGKFIQIIGEIYHPFISYILTGGNQQFASIEDFEHLKVMRWKD